MIKKSLSAISLLLTVVNLQSLLISDQIGPIENDDNFIGFSLENSCQNAQVYSYHIHVAIWERNVAHIAKAMDFQHRFMEEFDLIGKQNCTITVGDPAPS